LDFIPKCFLRSSQDLVDRAAVYQLVVDERCSLSARGWTSSAGCSAIGISCATAAASHAAREIIRCHGTSHWNLPGKCHALLTLLPSWWFSSSLSTVAVTTRAVLNILFVFYSARIVYSYSAE